MEVKNPPYPQIYIDKTGGIVTEVVKGFGDGKENV
jgi:hypothetical protein